MSRRLTVLAAVIAVLLAVSGCGGGPTTQPTSSGPSSSATATASGGPTATAPTAPAKVTLPGSFSGWTQYAGTVYKGCNGKIGGISPDAAVFDPRSGALVKPPEPLGDPGTTLNSATCAVTGTPDHLKLVEVVTTMRPAQGLQPQQQKTMAYVYELGSTTPTVSADISSIMPAESLAGTSTGLILFGDKGTTVLSNTDLAKMWTAPRPVAAGTVDAVVLGSTLSAKGIKIHSPTGELMLADPEAGSGYATALGNGTDQLIQFFRYAPGRTSSGRVWATYDVNARAYVDGSVFPSDLSQTVATVSNGRLFVHEDAAARSAWNFGT